MDKAEARKLLSGSHENLGAEVQRAQGKTDGSITGASVGCMARFLRTCTATRTISAENLTPRKVRDVMLQFSPLVEDLESQHSYASVVGAGFANLNPAVVAVVLDGDSVHMTAYAKEGLVNQHTADKALDQVEAELDIMRRMRHDDTGPEAAPEPSEFDTAPDVG